MKKSPRLSRINDEILRETAQIIRSELKDPRIGSMTSVVRVDTTNDLKYCKINVSVLGDADQKKAVMEGLDSAAGFIRKLLAERVNLRYTPELRFVFDDSLEYGARMNKLISDVAKADEAAVRARGEAPETPQPEEPDGDA